MKFEPVIGLEIHVQLKTDSKMFCSCSNRGEFEPPNTTICPVCVGHPGTLPVANKKAVESVIKVGLAVGADIADFTEFDRKNYFYPDIPKGYQISQYKYPIVSGGTLNGFGITRVKGAPRLAQEHAVGRVLHQGVLEQVARIKWDALPRQQTGF